MDLVTDARVIDWEGLGIALGVDDGDLETIAVDCRGDNEKALRTMYRKWLRGTARPSWSDVVQALLRVGEVSVAERVREKYLTV